jgi:hypothetical protein
MVKKFYQEYIYFDMSTQENEKKNLNNNLYFMRHDLELIELSLRNVTKNILIYLFEQHYNPKD